MLTTIVVNKKVTLGRKGSGQPMATDYVSEWMTEELRALRDVARQFFEREAAPLMAKRSEQRLADREFWAKAGSPGLPSPTVPEEHGGAGGRPLHQAAVTGGPCRGRGQGRGNTLPRSE